MSPSIRCFPTTTALASFLLVLGCVHSVSGQTGRQPAKPSVPCVAVDRFFVDEVWAKVGERTCLKCHRVNGDAAESRFLLQDPPHDRTARSDALRHNRRRLSVLHWPGIVGRLGCFEGHWRA